MKFNANSFKAIILACVFIVILFALAPNLVHTAAMSTNTLLTEFTNSTVYGATGASVATTVKNNIGALWLVGALGLIFTVILGFFAYKRR